MAATHERISQWREGEAKRLGVELGVWRNADPVAAKAPADEFFPEHGVDFAAKSPEGKNLWNDQPGWLDGPVNWVPTGNSSTTYFGRVINAANPVKAVLSFGFSDPISIWLNGEKLHSEFTDRSAAPNQVLLPVEFKAGGNVLLVKLFNKEGQCNFCFSLGNDPSSEIWSRIQKDFPLEASWMEHDRPSGQCWEWFASKETAAADKAIFDRAMSKTSHPSPALQRSFDKFKSEEASNVRGRLEAYECARRADAAMGSLNRFNGDALRRAIDDLGKTYPEYPAKELLARVQKAETELAEARLLLAENAPSGIDRAAEYEDLQRRVLLANPLLDFDKLLLVKRQEGNLGLPQNWQGDCAISSKGYDNEIATLEYKNPSAQPVSLYKPQNGEFVGDVDLHFDAGKMLFSSPGSNGRWQIWEVGVDGSGLRQVTLGEEPDVDNYDACYLPDERISFASTRCFQGIPCVGGSNTVANLCRMDADGANARMLCFDQDHNWCPTLLNNGQVMYSRWEYSDTSHYFSRLLFRMNPDGSGQMEYYGSNSYWPNSIFYSRPIPNDPSKIVAIVSGHHGVPRMGELIIFDPAKGRAEADGVVQRIPGYGKKVEPVIADQLVENSWPRFLHPYPLSDKYFLVSCKPSQDSPWGLYLVDTFDNMLLLTETPGYALFEPLPLRKTQRPPVIPDKVKLDKQDASVYLVDIYSGNGLKNVPRGTVKNLRVFAMHYCYPQMGGHIEIGIEGPWDVHQILGTVPVEEDGSAFFTVPANTPIAIQPLDDKGREMQIMRSWFTAMPGETLSCVGCHERQNMSPPTASGYAARRAPSAITPWKGPARGFDFVRDVQPVLDQRCTGCHNGADRPDGSKLPDFSRKDKNGWSNFPPSYIALHPYVRRPGPESDYHLQAPYEFSANTSELIQMLAKGHHGVQLDDDAWGRLYTWIDLNVPAHGTWTENRAIASNFHQRRIDMKTKYANRPEDPEAIPQLDPQSTEFVKPAPAPQPPEQQLSAAGWPFGADDAAKRQKDAAPETKRVVDLGDGVKMEFTLVPAGEFVMGGDGCSDEWPKTVVKIDKPFWLGSTEVTNLQYMAFDANHRSGYQDQQHKDHTTPGYSADGPEDPVIRVTWNEAKAFCDWLGEKCGKACSLPTEAQWEWACRAGSDSQFSYGDMNADFSRFANLADASIKLLAVSGINPQPVANPAPFEDFIPKDARFDDGAKITTHVAAYQPNAWGLFDMHGNVAEWTLSSYKPYPYDANDGRNDGQANGEKVARGGSWRDRPMRARSAFRLGYEPWQPVYNVGLRVAMSAE
jgi:formylglycine-generating enzyme required for sulfatase activity